MYVSFLVTYSPKGSSLSLGRLANFPNYLQTWLAEAYVTDHLDPLSYLYDVETAARWTGFKLHNYAFDVSWVPLYLQPWEDSLLT